VLGERPAPEDAAPPLEIDLEVLLPLVSRALVHELGALAPHGRGNEPPLFAATDVALAGPPRAVGRGQDHLQVELRQGRTVLKAIGFGLGARATALAQDAAWARLDIAFRPIISRWSGAETVELELRDLRPSAGVPAPAA
jgi:single-stranded-DNA-specific exonuclease